MLHGKVQSFWHKERFFEAAKSIATYNYLLVHLELKCTGMRRRVNTDEHGPIVCAESLRLVHARSQTAGGD